MSFEKPVITHRTALCLHTHCSYSCLRHLQKLLSNSGLRHTAEADNINKKRHAFPSGRSQVTVTTTGLGMMWVRRDITRWEVRSCCRSTHRLPAADLRSSGAVVLTGLVPQRDSPAPDAPLGTLFFLSFMLTDGSAQGNSAPLKGHWWQPCSGKGCGGQFPARGLLGVGRNMRLQQFLWSGIELVQHWNKPQIFSLSINIF